MRFEIDTTSPATFSPPGETPFVKSFSNLVTSKSTMERKKSQPGTAFAPCIPISPVVNRTSASTCALASNFFTRLKSSKFAWMAATASLDATAFNRQGSNDGRSLPTRISTLSSVHARNGSRRARARCARSLHSVKAVTTAAVVGFTCDRGSAAEIALLSKLTSTHAVAKRSMISRCSISHDSANRWDGRFPCALNALSDE